MGRGVGRRAVGGRMFEGAGRRERMTREPILTISHKLDPRYMAQAHLRPRGGMNSGPERRERMMKEFNQSISTQMLLQRARDRLDDMPHVDI